MKEFIVLVEDELDLLELLEYNLKKSGYDVEGFLEPSHVEELLSHESVDLLIMDRNRMQLNDVLCELYNIDTGFDNILHTF